MIYRIPLSCLGTFLINSGFIYGNDYFFLCIVSVFVTVARPALGCPGC